MKVLALIALFPLTVRAADPLANVPLKAKTLSCSPQTIHDGGTLTIRMSVPHPQELAIFGPDGSFHYLWRPDRSIEETVMFTNTAVVRLPTRTARASSSGGELLFNRPGWYTVQLSKNLERANSQETMSECRVYYSDRKGSSRARPNNSFKPNLLRKPA